MPTFDLIRGRRGRRPLARLAGHDQPDQDGQRSRSGGRDQYARGGRSDGLVDYGQRGRSDGLGQRRRRALLLSGVLLLACSVVLTRCSGGDGGTEGTRLGPTLPVAARDLATTLEASGSLRRSSELTVAYAGTVSSDDGSDIDPVAYLTDPADPTDPTGTPVPTTTPVTCPPATTVPPSTSTTSSTSTTTTSTTTPTTSTTGTPSTTSPPTTSAPTTGPPPSTTAPAPSGSGGRGGGPAAPAGNDGPTGDGGGSRPSSAAPGDGGDSGGGGVPSAVVTGLLDVGRVATRGTVLYAADEQPVVALLGDLPAWRTLERGVDGGADVRQLEANLVALGYGAGIDVDDTFTAATADAVEAWETDLGRDDPDGVVTLGDVVFLTAPGDVLGHRAAVGDVVEPGSPVLTLGSEERIVVAEIDATTAGGWTPGTTVELAWADGSTGTGTVFGTGKDVADGRVELVVALAAGDAGAGGRRSGAEATVTLVDASRDHVIAVPVAAIVGDGEGAAPAVRVVRPTGPDELVPVETGLVANGWIEITAGLDGGENIRLPA